MIAGWAKATKDLKKIFCHEDISLIKEIFLRISYERSLKLLLDLYAPGKRGIEFIGKILRFMNILIILFYNKGRYYHNIRMK